MPDIYEDLIAEYSEWCRSQSLPMISADEHELETLSPAQIAWLRRFMQRWEDAK